MFNNHKKCVFTGTVLALSSTIVLSAEAASTSSELFKQPEKYPAKSVKESRPACVFTENPEYEAPLWVCGVPIENIALSQTGLGADSTRAYLDALHRLLNYFGTLTSNLTKENDDKDFENYTGANFTIDESLFMFTEYSILKTDEQDKFGRFYETFLTTLTVQGELTLYNEVSTIGILSDEGLPDTIRNSIISGLSFTKGKCDLNYTYFETHLNDYHFASQSTEDPNGCSFSEVVDYFDERGIHLTRHIQGPNNGHAYVLLSMDEATYIAAQESIYSSLNGH